MFCERTDGAQSQPGFLYGTIIAHKELVVDMASPVGCFSVNYSFILCRITDNVPGINILDLISHLQHYT